MPHTLLIHAAGRVERPDRVLCDRADGGHLVVLPPRPVWDRTALDAAELAAWSLLVAATGQAMLETLPALRDGCLNYWDAGNWALNERAEPAGPKQPRRDRHLHLHLFGRSRHACHPDWAWGESPRFPAYADAQRWSAAFVPLSADECAAIGARAAALLASSYRLDFVARGASLDRPGSAS